MEDSKGNIWIGMEKGASCYQGNSQNFSPRPTDVSIQSVNTNLRMDLTSSKLNQLDYDENSITIHYQCLTYFREQDLQLRYQLFDPNKPDEAVWEYINNESSSEVRFSNLSPGNYEFRIQARNLGFEWGKPQSIRWQINQPYYNQIWFILLTGAFTVFFIGLIFQLRYQFLIRRKKQLEKIIERRTKEIQDLNDHLEEKVEERTRLLKDRNKKLEEYAFINAHLLRGPLTRIMSVLILVKEEQPELVDNQYFTLLQNSTEELDEVIHRINSTLAEEKK
jgi:signal transduction histidine kinase